MAANNRPDGLHKKIRAYLKENPNSPSYVLAKDLGYSKALIGKAISVMRNVYKTKLIYISGWERVSSPRMTWICALYSLGKKADAPKLAPLPRTAVLKKYHEKRKRRVNSVFDLGVPIYRRRIKIETAPKSTKRKCNPEQAVP